MSHTNTSIAEASLALDAWKRGVIRRAPDNFRIRVLPPEKHGSNYSYGLRIYPIKSDGTSAAIDEYDIWRKWEDCLWFQETLEVAYSLAAREKRNRLAAGKGVKKNGVYIHSDQAASWDSLPFGPDPRDIAFDIHQYIPKLSKKATLFRDSQEIVNFRYQSFRMMLRVLFQDDLPTLIREIKTTRTFTDFFGVWKRDNALAEKAQSQQTPATDLPRLSLTSSILSAFPISPGSRSTKSSSSSIKGKAPYGVQIHPAIFINSDSSSEETVDSPRLSRSMDRKQGIRSARSRGSSTGSHSSSSTPSTPVTMPRQLPPTSRQPAIGSQEAPLRFGHNPHVCSMESPPFILESLPEDREFSSSPKSDVDAAWSQRWSESTGKANRNARVYVPPPSSSLDSPDSTSRSLSRFSRASLQSTHSSATLRATAYLDELDVDYCLPSPTPEPRIQPRASVSSLASLVTNSSVDAVIPRSERSSRSSGSISQRSRFLPEALREEEPWSEDDSRSEVQEDLLDAYFNDMIGPVPQTPLGFPETPTVDDLYHFAREQSSTTVSSSSGYSDRRSSWTASISSGSTSSSGNLTTISIKAIHEDNIVILRLPRYITFDELRQKIYDKFMLTAKPTICETFAIALMEQTPAGKTEEKRSRADSLSSLGSARSKGAALHFISSQDKWDDIVATHYGKMCLRIIGSRE